MDLTDTRPSYDWSDPTMGVEEVKPRPIIVEGLVQRGVVTFVTGPGAVAKSLFAQQVALMVSTGAEWAHWKPREAGPIVIVNGEDDMDEQRRRFFAAMSVQPVVPERVHSLDATRITMFAPSVETGQAQPTELWQAIKAKVRETNAALLVIDPLVESHDMNENDNGHMATVVAHLRKLARDENCAVLVVHHSRKGAVGGDQDGARGASSLVNASRMAITLNKMTQDEAKNLLPEKERGDHARYICVSDPKVNYGPSLGGRWLHLSTVEHPNGEVYPVLKEGRLKRLTEEALMMQLCNRELRWPGDKRSGHRRQDRVDIVLAEELGVAELEVHKMLKKLIKRGSAHLEDRRDNNGNAFKVVLAGRPPEMLDSKSESTGFEPESTGKNGAVHSESL